MELKYPVPKQILGYQILETIGVGGSGIVKLAQTEDKSLYALKIIEIKPQQKDKSLNEARMHVKLGDQHQNLLKAPQGFFVSKWENKQYLIIVLEYCPDGNLTKLIGKTGEQDCIKIIEQVASALAFLHEKNIVHRDIKPQNILMANGILKICDFGLARKEASQLHSRVGTLQYMGPQLFYNQTHNIKVDIWALGILCLQLLIGKRITELFQSPGNQVFATIKDFPPESLFLKISCQKMRGLVKKMLDRSPQERPSAKQIMNEIAQINKKFKPAQKFSHQNIRKYNNFNFYQKEKRGTEARGKQKLQNKKPVQNEGNTKHKKDTNIERMDLPKPQNEKLNTIKSKPSVSDLPTKNEKQSKTYGGMERKKQRNFAVGKSYGSGNNVMLYGSKTEGIQTFNNIFEVFVRNEQRRCTDMLCTIIGVIVTLVLGIVAIVIFNRINHFKKIFPSDTEGFLCGYEYPGYNYLYFSKPTQLKNRLCVQSCPILRQNSLECKKSDGKACQFGTNIEFYESEPVQNDYGMFCLPKDEKARDILMAQIQRCNRDLSYEFQKIGTNQLSGAGFIVILAFFYTLFFQCFSKIVHRVTIIIFVLMYIAVIINIIILRSNITDAFKATFLVMALIFAFVLVCFFFHNLSDWNLNQIFLKFGADCIKSKIYIFVFPVVFLGLFIVFLFVQILMHKSFWSFGVLQFDPSVNLYHRVSNPTFNCILSFFQIAHILWGTMFLKECFTFLVSAEAVQWYFGNGCGTSNALYTLFCRHLGSVIGCAYLNAFFSVGDFILCALPSTKCKEILNQKFRIFDFVRCDSLCFVYLTSNSYCVAANYCQYISYISGLMQDSRPASRFHRLAIHLTLAVITIFLALYVFGLNVNSQNAIPFILKIMFVSVNASTFFISAQIDASQTILTLFLLEEELFKRGTQKLTDKFREIKGSSEHISQRFQKIGKYHNCSNY